MRRRREASAGEGGEQVQDATQRLKLIVSYDGRDFAGWQSQTHGNTIQDRIERAFLKICQRKVAVIGAGRTDAGVHALGQCAHADVPAKRLSAAEWLSALNGTLPLTIRVLKSRFVFKRFHARFSAEAKLYRYRIINSSILSPFELGRAWHVARPLTFKVLQEGAGLFVGSHNFARFAARGGKSEADTMRTVKSVRVSRRGELIVIEICGSGFLYKMARMMVGALVRCALSKEPLAAITMRLEDRSRESHSSVLVAPAHGLYLVRVRY